MATPSSRSSTDGAGDVQFVLVGRIVKPHGLRGEVVVRVLSDNPARFEAGAQLLVGSSPETAEPMEVASARAAHGRLLVSFQEISRVEEAEPLRGLEIFVAAESLQELGEDEFWEHEILGLTVEDTAGTVLGTLGEVAEGPAQDLWTIRTPGGDVLFPAARELVISIDVGERRIVVDPPKGLFE